MYENLNHLAKVCHDDGLVSLSLERDIETEL